jgi:putative hemolysin
VFTVDEVLNKHYPNIANKPLLFKPLKFILRRLLHEKDVVEFGEQYGHLSGLDFVEQVLEYFSISFSVRDIEKERIPASGKCVIIANHPIGSLDALALIKLIMDIRSDLKVVANEMLMALKPMHELLLPVNNMQGNTPKQNLTKIHQHLKNEGIVLIFPAGEVSRLRPQGVRDTKWHSGFIRIAKQTKCPILPVYIDAKNSPMFYSVSMLFKPLATILLIQEMFKQKENVIGLRIGELIPNESYLSLKLNYNEQTLLFKRHIYKIAADKPGLFETQKAIALAEDRRTLLKEMNSMCELLGETKDNKKIYLYKHETSSAIMREIGRLREISFRAVGEGTNKRRDVDSYDRHYFHLILWDEKELEIAGAYRFGDAQKLSKPDHPTGLYSSSLFDYQLPMQKYFEEGLELGRSFVQPKYWGKRSLDYLWFGIGAFIKQYPHYRYLFGPVSIPGTYPQTAISLLVDFYSKHFPHQEALAHPKTPVLKPKDPLMTFAGEHYDEEFSQLKDVLSHMNIKVPTLVKQYSEVCEPDGVSYIAFNRDPDFNDCIDGLVMIDLNKLTKKKRKRYLS